MAVARNIDDSIIKKIQGMLKLSESANKEEAANALAKAQFFLAKHNLTLAQVLARDVEALYDTVEQNIIGHSRWRAMLLSVIARHNFCHAVYVPKLGKMLVVGYKDNQEAVLAMYRCVEPQLVVMAAEEWKYSGQGNIARWKDSFYLGVNTTIDERLKAAHEQMLIEYETPKPPVEHSEDVFIPRPESETDAPDCEGTPAPQENPMRALMVIHNKKLERSIQKHFPKTTQTTKQIKARSAYERGLQAGHNVTLAGGLIEGPK